MSKKYLIDSYKCLMEEYFRKAIKVNKNFRRAEIHEFRITFKKIIALRNFIKLVASINEIDNEELKNLYELAGKLRADSILKNELKGLQIYNKKWEQFFKIKKVKIKADYANKLLKFRKKWKSYFISEINIFNAATGRINNLEKDVKDYLENKLAEIRQYKISENPEKSSLHDLRKKAKEFGYNYELLREALFLSLNDKFMSKIDKLNRVLGKWHDKIMLKKFIIRKVKFGTRFAEQIQKDIEQFESDISLKLLNIDCEYL